jgi:hypothetical protein
MKKNMTCLEKLTKLLTDDENDISLPKYKSKYKELNEGWRKKFDTALESTYCCHNTGWGGKDPGELEEHEKSLLDAIDMRAAVLIKLRYGSLRKMRDGWETHWIRQDAVRIDRFKHITKKVFDKVDELLSNVNMDTYVEENFDSLTKGFKVEVALRQIENKSLTYDQVLEGVSKQEISVEESKTLLKNIEKESADKLCPFSGSGSDPDRPRRICSRTGDPKKIGDCGSCRVAAEWEECYG